MKSVVVVLSCLGSMGLLGKVSTATNSVSEKKDVNGTVNPVNNVDIIDLGLNRGIPSKQLASGSINAVKIVLNNNNPLGFSVALRSQHAGKLVSSTGEVNDGISYVVTPKVTRPGVLGCNDPVEGTSFKMDRPVEWIYNSKVDSATVDREYTLEIAAVDAKSVKIGHRYSDTIVVAIRDL